MVIIVLENKRMWVSRKNNQFKSKKRGEQQKVSPKNKSLLLKIKIDTRIFAFYLSAIKCKQQNKIKDRF